jgi:1-deoxyxylulose-5-phosphate synthase
LQYTTLGRTGIRVSRVCLGTMVFHPQVGEGASHRIMDKALDLGINFFDTADIYQEGIVEEFVGNWLPSRRQQVVLATKVRGRMGPGQNDTGLSRLHIMRGVEDSLRRLRTDYIDLYQVHAPDDQTPIETTMRALDDLVRQGKVRAIGCSNYAAWELCKALWVSDKLGLERFESAQPCYSLLYRQPEAELFPLCQAEQVGVMVYEPMAAGLLSGKFRWDGKPGAGTRYDLRGETYRNRFWFEPNFQIVDKLRPLAAQGGRSMAQFALAWILGNPAVTSVISGVTSVAQLEENAEVADHPLTPDEYAAACQIAVGAVTYQPTGPRSQ